MVENNNATYKANEEALIEDGFVYICYSNTGEKYEIYRKIINGKGVWKALNYITGALIDITYDQALGYEFIEDTSINRLRKELGALLLPRR